MASNHSIGLWGSPQTLSDINPSSNSCELKRTNIFTQVSFVSKYVFFLNHTVKPKRGRGRTNPSFTKGVFIFLYKLGLNSAIHNIKRGFFEPKLLPNQNSIKNKNLVSSGEILSQVCFLIPFDWYVYPWNPPIPHKSPLFSLETRDSPWKEEPRLPESKKLD